MTARIDSGSIRSPSDVDETASMKSTVTVLRTSVGCWAATSAAAAVQAEARALRIVLTGSDRLGDMAPV